MDREKARANRVGVAMRVVISRTGRFLGRLSLQVVPSVTASVVAGYLLAQLVPQRGPAAGENAATSRPDENVAIVNDRAPIRVPPSRNAQASEPPAEVKRVATKPAEKPVAVRAEPKSEAKSEAKAETKAEVRTEPRHTAVTPAVPVSEPKAARTRPVPAEVQQVYTPEPYTPESDLPQVASQPVLSATPIQPASPPAPKPMQQLASQSAPPPVSSAPPLAAPTNVGPATGAPTALSPVVVNAPRQAAPAATVASAEPNPPQAEGERGVFSAISNAAGTAANVTGDTINWVIDLPGKLIGQDKADNRQQAQPRRFM
jgi:hypothetical protein